MNSHEKAAKPKKRKLTIAIDEDTIAFFQMLGHKEERPYQPLMNKVLRDYVQNEVQAKLDNLKGENHG
jgi:uncharacterized protein (DUF4415 family)